MSDEFHSEGARQLTPEDHERLRMYDHAKAVEDAAKGRLMRGAAYTGLGLSVAALGAAVIPGPHFFSKLIGAAAVAAGLFVKKAWDGIMHSGERDRVAVMKHDARLRTT